MNKRLITKKQEQVLKLCHHDFSGMSQEEAAKKLGISSRALGKLLARVEKVLPQYFPILTELEAKCHHHYMTEGWPIAETAEHMGHTRDTIYKTLQRAKDKGMYFTEARGRVLSYDKSMDANVKERF